MKKIFEIQPEEVNADNFEAVMQQAIALELSTIPTYLSTYYSINRAQDQDELYDKLVAQLLKATGPSDIDIHAKAQELKLDILVYANKTAALIMSVVIEEMLHLALASNVKQAIASPPDLMSIGKILTFPTQLDGHEPEFVINAAKLSLNQLSTFLQIESPKPFDDPEDTPETDPDVEKYKTIGDFYQEIISYVGTYRGPYSGRPQLLPPQGPVPSRPYYSQNSINTVYYDRDHNPHFGSADDSGGLIRVTDNASAIAAMNEIQDQGEGNIKKNQSVLQFGLDNMPIPLPVINGKVQFQPGDYDDSNGKELSHFAKFLEVYSFGVYYEKKFAAIQGLDDFFSYFVRDQAANPKQADYDAFRDQNANQYQTDCDACGNPAAALSLCSQLGNAIFTYILLMVETCYYQDEPTQFKVFLYGVHKSMIWLLSGVGNAINKYFYIRNGRTWQASLTFEYYDFTTVPGQSPRQQILQLATDLAAADPVEWGWLTNYEYASYWPSLPDVGLDHSVVAKIPAIPA